MGMWSSISAEVVVVDVVVDVVVAGGGREVGVGGGGGARNSVAKAEAQSYTLRRYRDSRGGRPSWEER